MLRSQTHNSPAFKKKVEFSNGSSDPSSLITESDFTTNSEMSDEDCDECEKDTPVKVTEEDNDQEDVKSAKSPFRKHSVFVHKKTVLKRKQTIGVGVNGSPIKIGRSMKNVGIMRQANIARRRGSDVYQSLSNESDKGNTEPA